MTEQQVREGKQSPGGRVMETKGDSPRPKVKPGQEQGHQVTSIKGHDGKVHGIPNPKAAEPQQPKGGSQGQRQQAGKPKLTCEQDH